MQFLLLVLGLIFLPLLQRIAKGILKIILFFMFLILLVVGGLIGIGYMISLTKIP